MDATLKRIYEDLILALGHLGQADGQSYWESQKEIAEAREYVTRALEELVAFMDGRDSSLGGQCS